MFRIGQGYDVHRLVEGRKLMICGIDVPYERGLLGHSDADVALHALMDALLGALALGDIGKLFPDKDPAYLNADSTKLLANVAALIEKNGYRLINADITIIAQAPKFAPFIQQMRERVAAVLEVNSDQISIKATTTEKLGFTGRGEGIAAEAIVLLQKKVN